MQIRKFKRIMSKAATGNVRAALKGKLNIKKIRPFLPIRSLVFVLLIALCLCVPTFSRGADGPGLSGGSGLSGLAGLYGVLDGLYDELVPLSSKLIGVARALAGFAALWYIAVRVWRHLARAEPVDVYPLLRPFALGLAILLFLPLVSLINGLLHPVDIATRSMAGDSRQAILVHIQHEEAEASRPAPAGLNPVDASMSMYEAPDGTGDISDSSTVSVGLKSSFSFLNIKYTFKTVMVSFVSMLYEAAALCINTIRTFYLIILTILGPLVLGLSVFDGFRHTLMHWFARYINIYMWLPVANIFGGITTKILEHMLRVDQDFLSSTAYVIFMLIAIVGYTAVPSIASHIVQVGGHDSLLGRLGQLSTHTLSSAAATMDSFMTGESPHDGYRSGEAGAFTASAPAAADNTTASSHPPSSSSLPGTGY
ncbi:hypothetical protein [Arachidicoccus rhizosphaerae]|nr:hypothetical protein [Arachidicoccus rhizosphaerae]